MKRFSTLLNVESKVIVSRLHGLGQAGLVEGGKMTSSKTLCYSLTEKGRDKVKIGECERCKRIASVGPLDISGHSLYLCVECVWKDNEKGT